MKLNWTNLLIPNNLYLPFSLGITQRTALETAEIELKLQICELIKFDVDWNRNRSVIIKLPACIFQKVGQDFLHFSNFPVFFRWLRLSSYTHPRAECLGCSSARLVMCSGDACAALAATADELQRFPPKRMPGHAGQVVAGGRTPTLYAGGIGFCLPLLSALISGALTPKWRARSLKCVPIGGNLSYVEHGLTMRMRGRGAKGRQEWRVAVGAHNCSRIKLKRCCKTNIASSSRTLWRQ